MTRPLRVVLIEDEADAALIHRELGQAGVNIVTERVDSKDHFIMALRNFAPDVVCCARALPELELPAAVAIVQVMRPVAPVIVVAESLDERETIACVRAGAADVVPKTELSRLPAAITAAIAVRTGLEKLSPRQLQVLRFVAVGKTTREIARDLRLSVKTVETHRTQLMRRLGVHDVAALVRFAMRVGLVPPENTS